MDADTPRPASDEDDATAPPPELPPGSSSDADIARLVELAAGGGPGSSEAGAALSRLGPVTVPFLAAAYERSRSWKARTALLYYAIPFARSSPPAFELGLRALHDRSYMVRYRACMVLAYSLRRDALPELENLRNHDDPRTRHDAARAIDAITHANHHYFVDPDHSGQTLWRVNDND